MNVSMLPRVMTAFAWLWMGWTTSSDILAGHDPPRSTPKSAVAKKLAARIDQHIRERLTAENLEPSPTADDAEFFRRITLHLAGEIPRVSEVRNFLEDSSAGKREAAIDILLARPAFVRHFATVWRRAWLPEADTDPQLQNFAGNLEAWLRLKLVDDPRYDDLVREALSVPLSRTSAAAVATGNDSASGPMALLLAREGKPENLAAGISRAFLGVRLDCAQCHDHPFDRWKREQFWSFAAFFAGLERGSGNQPTVTAALYEVSDRRELRIPDTNQLVAAVFLDGSEPKWRSQSGRQLLAHWITSRDNPYFARATVNRLWGHLFGIGLVDPVDDFSTANAPSHPELLDDLATALTDRDYDLKFLLKALLLSETYQRTSRQSQPEIPAALHASFPVQGLSAEELSRSLVTIIGRDGTAQEIAARFARLGESPTQRQTTILQALSLMNGPLTAVAIHPRQGGLLSAVTEFPGQTPAEQLDILFLATLSRYPTAAESQRCLTFVNSSKDSRKALGDVLWTLLNSTEFACNH